MRGILTGAVLVAALLAWSPDQAHAQLSGFNTRGDYGLQSASQPAPGWYVIAPMYVNYHADKFKNADGEAVLWDPDDNLTVNALVLGGIFVGDFTIFGGNYSAQLYPAWVDNSIEIPAFGIDQDTGMSFGDLYLQPINLGWRKPRADYTAGLGLYMPTGKYDFLGGDNIGLGMWGFEFFAGGTFYFDEARRWHFAATGFFETHTEKEDTEIKVGNLLTFEGGLGYSFLDGAAMVGAAYYAQWKVSDDKFGDLNLEQIFEDLDLDQFGELSIGKNRVFGAGPELSLPITGGNKLIALIDVRYIWEFSARTDLEGGTFVGTLTFPIPSISLE